MENAFTKRSRRKQRMANVLKRKNKNRMERTTKTESYIERKNEKRKRSAEGDCDTRK